MLRPLSLLAALVAALVATVATWGLPTPAVASIAVAAQNGGRGDATAPHTAAREAAVQISRQARRSRAAVPEAPLGVTIESLSPSVIPARGMVRVTGTVTNNDDQVWSRINVYSFISATPMTTSAELVDAVGTDPTDYVGDRILIPGTFDTIDRLEPGEQERYSFFVPRRDLNVTEAGVYWFGAHALGESAEGRDLTADGRARTFLPLAAAARNGAVKEVDTALVLQLRRQLSYADDGSLTDVRGWTRTLGDGRLRSLVDFGAAAGDRPISWLLDPGLPDAVDQLVAGNPARSLEPTLSTGEEPGDPSDSPTPSSGITTEPEEGGSASAASSDGSTDGTDGTDGGSDAPPELDADTAAAAESGAAWLARLHEALGSQEILELPYGDVDVAAAADFDPAAYERARARTGAQLDAWGLDTTPAVGAPDGYLDAAGIEVTDPDTTILATDRMFGAQAPSVARTAGHRLVVTSSAAASGGPGPSDPLDLVGLRQRILSEAVVRQLAPGHPTLVVMLPNTWTPSSATGFFAGLDVDWLHLTTVGAISRGAGRHVDLDTLDYPEAEQRGELDAANFAAADALVGSGESLQNLLTLNDQVAAAVTGQALAATSYAARERPDAVRVSADRAREWIQERLATVSIEAPVAVTLSSASGRFAATITNGLDQPVTVSINALSDGRMRIRAPGSVDIGAGGQAQLLLTARTSENGIHNVTLVLTDSDGTPLGATDELPIRAAQVSNVIWLFIGTAGALLFGAIAVRLVRRLRAARAAEPAQDLGT